MQVRLSEDRREPNRWGRRNMGARKLDRGYRVTRLRRDTDAGNMAATRDLGLTLLGGIKNRQGRSVVRRNSTYAVRLLERAAGRGDSMAAASLGYAYGVGQGVRRDSAVAIKWDRRAIGLGEIIAMGNLAAEYRRLGNLRLAHQWFLRAAKMGDGDAAVDAGYGYLYGIGVRRNLQFARSLLRLAARTTYVTPYAREEALYNLV